MPCRLSLDPAAQSCLLAYRLLGNMLPYSTSDKPFWALAAQMPRACAPSYPQPQKRRGGLVAIQGCLFSAFSPLLYQKLI
jgi:hypothetical protein